MRPSTYLHGLFCAACLVAGTALSRAQDAPPGIAPPTASTETGPIAPGSSNYQNAPVNTILDLYEQLSGVRLIRDANLTSVPPISINFNNLSKGETLRLILATLLLNGVSIQPLNDHTAKAITTGTNKNVRTEGLPLLTKPSELPDDEEVVSYFMPLDYINPQEAVGIFTQTAPVHVTYGAYVPAPTAQAVILTENASVIRQLIALKQLIDVPPAKVASVWVQLNRADADATVKILDSILGIGANGAPLAAANPGGVVNVPSSLGNDAPISNERNLISGTATIVSDPRSNRILLTTRPVNLPFLEQMIAQLDLPDIFTVPQRRDLHYVAAADILPALEAALAQSKDDFDQLKKDQQAAQTQTRNGTTGAAGSTAPQSTAGASSGGTGSVAAITPQLTAPSTNTVPTVLTIGKTRLMADNRSNSIIVFGSPDVVARVFDMVDELDRKPLQVYLRTVIGELTVQQGLEFGIDILQKFQHIGSGGLASSNLNSTSSGNAANFPEPSALTSAAGFPLPTGLTLYGAIGSTLNAYVRALETTDRFKIISTPSVYTTNNKLAVIATGSQVPVPSSITSTPTTVTDTLATTASVAYEDVLLQLDIIPLINAKHEVTLQIRQTNNTLGANILISGNEVPIINTQEINTEITVPNKATVVIGGLINDKTTRDASGLPFLSDIPVLGYLFGDVNKTKERDELIIMIEPTVVETDADQIAVNETEKQRTILGREAVEAATGIPAAQQSAFGPAISMAPTTVQTTVQTTTVHHPSPYNSKGQHTTTTTTTTVKNVPLSTQLITPVGPTLPAGPVPTLSSPAPDVQNGKLPPVNPPTGPPPITNP